MNRATQFLVLFNLASFGNSFSGDHRGRLPSHYPSGFEANRLSSTTTKNYPHTSLCPPSLHLLRLLQAKDDSENTNTHVPVIWLPQLRKVMAGVAMAGALETGYLTFQKTSGGIDALCGVDGQCQSVLQGPYSSLPYTDVPLSLLGFLAYTTVVALAVEPLLDEEPSVDFGNRVALTSITTAMGTFSVGLMIILFGVLQVSCPYCIFSAVCSIVLATLAWIGGCLPKTSQGNGPVAGFMVSTMGAVVLFVSATSADSDSSFGFPVTPSTVLASTSSTSKADQPFRPPDITTESSPRAMQLASQLQAMDAKMYGAYWCSHCFDQKETLGKQAFGRIPYVECSKDGVNSQTKLCKTQQIPGYPTWQIQGHLYPGEQSLEELEELVQKIQNGNVAIKASS